MKRILTNQAGIYHIIPLTQLYVPDVKRLCDEALGFGFYSEKDLEQMISQPNHFFYLLLCKKESQPYFYSSYEVIGFHYHYLCTFEEAAVAMQCDPAQMQGVVDGWEPTQLVGVLKSIGIRQNNRGRGLAYQLNQCAIDHLTQKGAHSIWVPAWRQKQFVPEHNTLLRQGFRSLCEVPDFWHECRTLCCPVCQAPKCVCSAVIYYKSTQPG